MSTCYHEVLVLKKGKKQQGRNVKWALGYLGEKLKLTSNRHVMCEETHT